jgi:peptidoglycan hydrolase CwlO-like protein
VTDREVLDAIVAGQQATHAKLEGLTQQVTELQGSVTELRDDVKELQKDVKELQKDVKELQGDMKDVKGKVTRLEERLADTAETTVYLAHDVYKLKKGK